MNKKHVCQHPHEPKCNPACNHCEEPPVEGLPPHIKNELSIYKLKSFTYLLSGILDDMRSSERENWRLMSASGHDAALTLIGECCVILDRMAEQYE
jgi:hypothetical protein